MGDLTLGPAVVESMRQENTPAENSHRARTRAAGANQNDEGVGEQRNEQAVAHVQMVARLDATTRLCDLVFPATHNSGTYETAKGSSRVRFDGVEKSVRVIQNLPLDAFVLCQEKSVLDQLRMGIRCLDLRVAYSAVSSEVWVVHAIPTVLCARVFDDIRAFLAESKTEFVLVRIKAGWEHRCTWKTAEAFRAFDEGISKHLGKDFVVLPEQFAGRTLHELPLADVRGRCALLLDDEMVRDSVSVVPEFVRWFFSLNISVQAHWANTNEVLQLEQNISAKLAVAESPNAAQFHEVSFVLTATAKDFAHLRSIKKMSSISNGLLEKKLSDPNLANFCIVSFDFASLELVTKVIKLNLMRRK